VQGLWKNDVSGWNHKDTKRKKQTRKNFLKDKAKAVYRIFDGKRTHGNDTRVKSEVFRRENENVKIYERPKRTFSKTAKVYKALISYRTYRNYEVLVEREMMDGSKQLRTVVKTDWTYNYVIKFLYDEDCTSRYFSTITRCVDSKKTVAEDLNLNVFNNHLEIRKLSDTYESVELDWEDAKARYESYNISEFEPWNQKIFLYGKLLNKHIFWKTYWNDGRRRKYGQKMVNGSDRTALREWISKKDWDKEPRSYQYSKSIDWYVN
jgi:hypothetical protein